MKEKKEKSYEFREAVKKWLNEMLIFIFKSQQNPNQTKQQQQKA